MNASLIGHVALKHEAGIPKLHLSQLSVTPADSSHFSTAMKQMSFSARSFPNGKSYHVAGCVLCWALVACVLLFSEV